MKPGMLMTLDGCQTLLKAVPNAERVGCLLVEFALARFLAFLCDFLRSMVLPGAPTWPHAQSLLAKRFAQIVGRHGEDR
jgi:hypothetical protein